MRAGWLSLLLSIALAAPGAAGRGLSKDQKIEHALSRLTFGARPGEAAEVRKLGLDRWIDRQLHPERIAEDPALEAKLSALQALEVKPAEMAPGSGRGKVAEHARDLAAAKLYRAIWSRRQLQEVLVDFWYNHFNVHFDKGADRLYVHAYERDAIRPHVLGKFGDLLAATARHPAMLFYLDNWQSADPNAFRGRARRGLNENFARELLELHTLGVDGGYTQRDVIEVARCFTGWTIRTPRLGGGFEFNARWHDRGEKVVLGTKIPAGGGIEDGERVLELLARHPATARHIARQLAERFVSDQPPAKLVERMARQYMETSGDLREVLKTMFRSKEFFSREAYRAKVKSPLETVVSAVRALDADVNRPAGLIQVLARLGQPLYRKPEPTGYSNAGAEWVSSAALLARMNFAIALAGNRVPGVRVEPAKIVLPAELPEAVAKAEDEPAKRVGLWLGSPEFQRR